MATISAAGLGSGLDLNGLVSQLVAAERAPAENRLSRETAKINAEISALGALTSTATGLKTALAGLLSGSAFGARTAKSSSEAFSAAATSAAAAGRYAVRVESLATTHKLASNAFASTSEPVGSGELSLSVGGETLVLIFDPAASISEIRDAINQAESNPGIRATVLNTADGARLVLSASHSGTAGRIQVSASGGDGGLAALAYEDGGTQNLSEVTPAQDAEVFIDGFRVTSSGNQISDAIEGVTLNLAAADPGVTHTLDVGSNQEPTLGAIEGVIKAYNAFVATAATVTRYDASSQQAATLVGDPAVRALGNRLRSMIGGEQLVSGESTTLAALGIKTGKDGTLSLDKAVFSEALAADPQGVRGLFTGSEGLAGKLTTVLDSYVGSAGVFTSRNASSKDRLQAIDDQRVTLDRRMEAYRARYQAQFSALDTLINQLQSTGNFLTQQLANAAG